MKTDNNKAGFFAEVFNIQDNKLPKISLFFIITIIFEFVVALPVYSYLSKKVGLILLVLILAEFIITSIYGVVKILKYYSRKKQY